MLKLTRTVPLCHFMARKGMVKESNRSRARCTFRLETVSQLDTHIFQSSREQQHRAVFRVHCCKGQMPRSSFADADRSAQRGVTDLGVRLPSVSSLSTHDIPATLEMRRTVAPGDVVFAAEFLQRDDVARNDR